MDFLNTTSGGFMMRPPSQPAVGMAPSAAPAPNYRQLASPQQPAQTTGWGIAGPQAAPAAGNWAVQGPQASQSYGGLFGRPAAGSFAQAAQAGGMGSMANPQYRNAMVNALRSGGQGQPQIGRPAMQSQPMPGQYRGGRPF